MLNTITNDLVETIEKSIDPECQNVLFDKCLCTRGMAINILSLMLILMDDYNSIKSDEEFFWDFDTKCFICKHKEDIVFPVLKKQDGDYYLKNLQCCKESTDSEEECYVRKTDKTLITSLSDKLKKLLTSKGLNSFDEMRHYFVKQILLNNRDVSFRDYHDNCIDAIAILFPNFWMIVLNKIEFERKLDKNLERAILSCANAIEYLSVLCKKINENLLKNGNIPSSMFWISTEYDASQVFVAELQKYVNDSDERKERLQNMLKCICYSIINGYLNDDLIQVEHDIENLKNSSIYTNSLHKLHMSVENLKKVVS